MKHFDNSQGAFLLEFQGFCYIKTLEKMPIWALYKVEFSVKIENLDACMMGVMK